MVKRKGTRRGFAGDDVTETEQFQDDVVAERDESFVVEDTDSDHTIETESTVITDDHEVVTSTEVGSEEDFVAESEEGDADTIDEDGRQGRRKGLRRRGSRRGESVIMDEDGTTEEVDLPEPDEEELEEREGRRGRRTRRGSRKGATLVDGKSPMDYLKMLVELQGLSEQYDIIQSGDEDAAEEYLKEDAYNNGKSYEESVRSIAEEFEDDSYLGGRKGSRMGAYGGKSPEHQSSIKAAVSVAMSDRRL